MGLIPFPRLLVLCEMQSTSSRIWTRIAVSISYDDNHYTTGTSKLRWLDALRWLCTSLPKVENEEKKGRRRFIADSCLSPCVCVCVCVRTRRSLARPIRTFRVIKGKKKKKRFIFFYFIVVVFFCYITNERFINCSFLW